MFSVEHTIWTTLISGFEADDSVCHRVSVASVGAVQQHIVAVTL